MRHIFATLVILAFFLCNYTVNAQKLPLPKDSKVNIKELNEREYKEYQRQINLSAFKVPGTIANKSFSSEGLRGLDVVPPRDRDRDGLSDEEEALLKTDPLNPDTDGDALIDSWEVGTINGIDLKAWKASPLHKDIFVEMDYMVRQTAASGLGPNARVILGIEEAFSASPVANPDGINGINIHLIPGNEIPYDENLFPLFAEFEELKRKHFDPRRAPVFHYMIWANAYEFSTSSGYSFDIPHSDFIVTLGRWNDNQGGTDKQKIGTFIHELGHNLGLRHGGSEDLNFKPNHLSVMNYVFQITGVVIETGGFRDYFFTYQKFALPDLTEASLLEADGLGKRPALTGYYTRYNSAGRRIEAKADDAIDWNANDATDKENTTGDLNADTYLTPLHATPNEWSQLLFKGGVIGEFGPLNGLIEKSIDQFKVQPFIELTQELAQQLEVATVR